MRNRQSIARVSVILSAFLSVAACGGGKSAGSGASPAEYTVGGSVAGLASGASVALELNGSGQTTISANGSFKLPGSLDSQAAYAVTVSQQPLGANCSLENATGVVLAANISNVAVSCVPISFTIGGTAAGLLAGQQVNLSDGSSSVLVQSNGSFSFPSPLSYGSSYTVVISDAAANETCSIADGSGTNVVANVTGVQLNCTADGYRIGGTVTGLAAGQSLTLADNGGTGGNIASVANDGAFTFAAPVTYGGAYAVTVTSQPQGQFCTVAAGSGSGVTANVANVAISCATAWYVSGTGLDTHDGMTPATAFRTLAKAASVVQAGQIVLAMDGTYTNDTGGSVLSISNAGTPNAWITFEAYPGAHPVVQTDGIWEGIFFAPTAQYIEVNGFTVTGNSASLTLTGAQAVESNPGNNPLYNGNCIAAQAAKTPPYPHHLRILNNVVSECPGGGIATIGADYVTISGNTVYNNALYSAYGCSGISTLIDYDSNPSDTSTQYKMIITNNIVYGNQEFIPWQSAGAITDGEGIIIDSNHNNSYDSTVPYPAYTGRTLIANNVVFGNGSAAIEIFQSSHVDVVNNSTYGNVITPYGQSAAQAKISGRGEMSLSQMSDVKVYNNIFYSLTGQNPLAQFSSCTDCNVDYNLYYGGANLWNGYGTNGPHDISGSPQYLNTSAVSPASVNLQLAPTSPAIGAGTSQLAPATDINGKPRPSKAGYTLGAYSE